MQMTVKRLVRLAPIVIVLVLTLGFPTSVRAGAGCGDSLLSCYGKAAAFADTWWSMWGWGIDCELSFLDCTRLAILGR
jgi:hypothetical protein